MINIPKAQNIYTQSHNHPQFQHSGVEGWPNEFTIMMYYIDYIIIIERDEVI